MRIAFIIRSLGVGGAERQIALLARALFGRGHSILLVVYYDGGPIIQELTQAGVAVVTLGKRSRWDLLGPLFRLRRVIGGFRPTIVHGYLTDGNLVSLLVGRWMHRASVVWGVRASHYDFTIYDRFFRLLFLVSCRLARWVDLIIANSDAGEAYHVARGYPPDRFVVIPNGIDTQRFGPDPVRREEQRRAWGIPDDGFLIGMVGRLDPMKDHPTFLRAAALTARKLPDARFVIVGDGPAAYRQRLLDMAEEAGLAERFRWVEAADDMPAVYNALDLLLSLSNSGEGFPNVIGEAMASEVRCVVTDVGDSTRVLGETGEVVPTGDPAAVAAVCIRLHRQGRTAASTAARRRVEEEFSVEALAQRTEVALSGLLAARERRSGS